MTKVGPINQPISVSLSPKSRLSGPTSRGTIPRSSILIMSASAKTNTAYQARDGLGQGSVAASSAILFSDRELVEILVASVLIQCSSDLNRAYRPYRTLFMVSFPDHICFGSGFNFT